MLVKDACNPVSDDEYPFSRCFDWYHGHSWAHGVIAAPDGKDEESTSEDGMFAYGLKMWGKITGDKSMEQRGNLMLAILARTFSNYFLMEKSNINQPSQFIGRKVTGIVRLPAPSNTALSVASYHLGTRADSQSSCTRTNALTKSSSVPAHTPFRAST